MHNLAKDFLVRGGRIRAPRYYASTVLPGVIPHFSLNGRYQTLTYNPNNENPYHWEVTGLSLSEGDNLEDTCQNDAIEAWQNYRNATLNSSDTCVQHVCMYRQQVQSTCHVCTCGSPPRGGHKCSSIFFAPLSYFSIRR